MTTLPTMPHDLAAERMVLGSCLTWPHLVDTIAGLLAEDDWYSPAHAAIWETILAVSARREPVDTLTVRAALGPRLREVGGDEALLALVDAQVTPTGAEQHAARIAKLAAARRMALACAEVFAAAASVTNADEWLDEAEARVLAAVERRAASGPVTMRAAVTSVFQDIHQASVRGDKMRGIPSGLAALDAKLLGLKPGELIVVCGRPGMGKSALAGAVIAALAEGGHPSLVASLEMPAQQWAQRALTSDARIDGEQIRSIRLSADDWTRLTRSSGRLVEWPVWVDDSAAMTVHQLRAHARRIKARHDLALVVVDYVQLMRSGNRHDVREQEVAAVSRALKALAKELAVPVIALAQLNRAVESRGDKRPMMSDLRESGSLEQDADVVIGLYRREVYAQVHGDAFGWCEAIVLKQRQGPTGTCYLGFDAPTTRFYNRDGEPPKEVEQKAERPRYS